MVKHDKTLATVAHFYKKCQHCVFVPFNNFVPRNLPVDSAAEVTSTPWLLNLQNENVPSWCHHNWPMPISSSMISIIWAHKLLNGRPPKNMNQRCGTVGLSSVIQNMDGTLFSLALYWDSWVTKLKCIRTCLIFSPSLSLSLSLHRPLREFSIFAAVYLSLPQQPAFALLAPAMPSRSVIAASRPMQQSHTGSGQKHQIGRSKSLGCTWLYQHFLLDQVYTRDLILESLTFFLKSESFPGPPPVTCGAPWQPRQMVQLLKGWTVTCWKCASFIREHHELCTKMCSPPRPNLDLRTLSCTRSQQLALHIVCLTWGRPGPASPNVEGVTQCSNRMRMKAIMLEWGDRRVCVTCYNVCPLFFFTMVSLTTSYSNLSIP